MGFVRSFIEGLWNDAISYGVSPQIFVAMYLITWPMWYYTMWWVVSGWHRKDRSRMRKGVWSNRVVTVAPYVYVMLAGGTAMPWKWWAFTVVLPIATTTLFLHKIKNDEWMEKWWEFYKKNLARFRFKKADQNTDKEVNQ